MDSFGNVVIGDPYIQVIQVLAEKTGTFYGVAMTAGNRLPRGVDGGQDGRRPSLVAGGGDGGGKQIQAPCREVFVADLQRAVIGRGPLGS